MSEQKKTLKEISVTEIEMSENETDETGNDFTEQDFFDELDEITEDVEEKTIPFELPSGNVQDITIKPLTGADSLVVQGALVGISAAELEVIAKRRPNYITDTIRKKSDEEMIEALTRRNIAICLLGVVSPKFTQERLKKIGKSRRGREFLHGLATQIDNLGGGDITRRFL